MAIVVNELKAQVELYRNLVECAKQVREKISSSLAPESDGFLDREPDADIDDIIKGLKNTGTEFEDDGEDYTYPSFNFRYGDFNSADLNFPVPGGRFELATALSDYGTRQASICYRPLNPEDHGYDGLFDICTAEVRRGELADIRGMSEDNKNVSVYVWADPETNDYTHEFTLKHSQMLDICNDGSSQRQVRNLCDFIHEGIDNGALVGSDRDENAVYMFDDEGTFVPYDILPAAYRIIESDLEGELKERIEKKEKWNETHSTLNPDSFRFYVGDKLYKLIIDRTRDGRLHLQALESGEYECNAHPISFNPDAFSQITLPNKDCAFMMLDAMGKDFIDALEKEGVLMPLYTVYGKSPFGGTKPSALIAQLDRHILPKA